MCAMWPKIEKIAKPAKTDVEQLIRETVMASFSVSLFRLLYDEYAISVPNPGLNEYLKTQGASLNFTDSERGDRGET